MEHYSIEKLNSKSLFGHNVLFVVFSKANGFLFLLFAFEYNMALSQEL